MKKLLLLAMLVFAGTANAQTENTPTEKGNWIIGGATNLKFMSTKPVSKQNGVSEDGQKTSNFTLTPTFGYFVIDNLSVGMDLELSVQKSKEYTGYEGLEDIKSTIFSVLPSATYYFATDSKALPYIGAGAGYAVAKNKIGNIGNEPTNFFVWKIKGGMSYMITKELAVDLGLSYNQLSTKFNYPNGINQKVLIKNFGANIGFNIFLN